LSGSIPATIGNLEKLFWLNLGNNQLFGSIPATIGNLEKLYWLNLGKNRLEGFVPATIGNLVNLLKLYLSWNQLSGEIPSEIGNLKYLEKLYVSHNQLSGDIPEEIQKLKNLQILGLGHNLGLIGFFTAQCSTQVFTTGTGVIICGCGTAISPASVYPPPETPDECFSTSSASSLEKRTFVFLHEIGSYKYTCDADLSGNPFQDCFNMMAAICHPAYIGTDTGRKDFCKDKVNYMTQKMSPWWQTVRKACGKWSYDGTTGDPNSSECSKANTALQKNAYYTTPDGEKIRVTSALTDSLNIRLWNLLS